MNKGWIGIVALFVSCAVANVAFAEPEAASASAAAPSAAATPSATASATPGAAPCGGEPPPRMCQAAESSPRLANDDPRVKAILAVWSRVERPFAALTGRVGRR